MKRQVLSVLVFALIFSLLFYEQRSGVNYLLFTLAILGFFIAEDRTRMRQSMWMLLASTSLLTGFFVFWHGTVSAVIANLTALSFLTCVSLLPKTTFFPAMVYSLFSYIASFVHVIIDLSERSSRPKPKATNEGEKPEKPKLESSAKAVIIVLGLVVLLVFVYLYRGANPVFKEFTDNINLDFISGKWVLFTLFGFLMMYGFFFIRHSKGLYKNDSSAPAVLMAENHPESGNTFLGFRMDSGTENFIVTVFLVLLNALLLLLNVLDISFLANGGNLPTDVNYADYVHRGVGTLIVSVILVIIITMYFFRGGLNFSEKAPRVRLWAAIWLVQNMIMLVSTSWRNTIYIDEYSLTYKRIGVYVWLLLTFFGLITTLWKVRRSLSSWFLVRTNGWAFFTAIILLGSVNWDILIARYNTRNPDDADYEYLLRLNDNALPNVYDAAKVSTPDKLFEAEEDFHFDRFALWSVSNSVDDRIRDFNNRFESSDWRSWNYDDWVTYRRLP